MLVRHKLSLSVALTALVIAACSSSNSRATFEAPPAGGDEKPPEQPPALGNGKSAPLNDVTIKGTVFAPNGDLPMANTLVYLTREEPAPIPEGIRCDECVGLPEDMFAFSNADGTFEWATQLPSADYWVVVQKGQFRRVRKITVDKAGEIALEKEMTTLPGRRNAAKGDDVPKMAILKGTSYHDHIDETLSKLGIEDVESIDDGRKLLENPAELAKYNVVFIPCGEKDAPQIAKPAVKQNIKDYVAAGGRFYVTDWSYEYVRQPFPNFLAWEGETSTLGSGTISLWKGPAKASDQGLGDWLSATGDAKFDVEGNWTEVKQVRTLQGPGPDGTPVEITPRVWVTATRPGSVSRPTTVSFEHQCGRVLFSTYHTESNFGTTLHAQEKALFYVLLEVGVCIGEQGKPK